MHEGLRPEVGKRPRLCKRQQGRIVIQVQHGTGKRPVAAVSPQVEAAASPPQAPSARDHCIDTTDDSEERPKSPTGKEKTHKEPQRKPRPPHLKITTTELKEVDKSNDLIIVKGSWVAG